MGCGCGGGRVRFDNVARPTVRAQPNYGVRINGGAGSATGAQTFGAVQSNPNTPIQQQKPTTRTQV